MKSRFFFRFFFSNHIIYYDLINLFIDLDWKIRKTVLDGSVSIRCVIFLTFFTT